MEMLLITFNVWFGPSKARMSRGDNGMKVEEKIESYATRLPLPKALRRVQAYERAFNERYAEHSAVNYTLLTVATIPHLTAELLDVARVKLIESMAQTADQVGQ